MLFNVLKGLPTTGTPVIWGTSGKGGWAAPQINNIKSKPCPKKVPA